MRCADVVSGERQKESQRLRRIQIVIHNQHSKSGTVCSALFGLFLYFDIAQLCGERGQEHRKRTSLAWPIARRLNCSAVHLDKIAHQRQPDSETALSAIERSIRLR